ncbi:MAG TPA: rod shape-determining protein MreC [bacterium]|jgi:rod shape-determining protein MreC|nr:rod shape-determining protein MreC [Dictyoglomota bacterium]HHV81601.1 rod shape-determining protein MreC [bacterium]HOK29429.1 rod shape-determining protein MreC [bacterium]HOL54806.1 rod shape-determining protein MreC [bacterium]HOP55786.1 rod shape-determining protein MreC [bacterium]
MFFIDTVGTRGENPVAKILNFIRDVGGFISRIKVSMEESFISAYMFLERQSHLVQYSRNLELQIARLKTENNVLTNQAEELKRLEITSGFKERNRRFNLTGAKIIRREPAQWLNTVLLDRGKVDGVSPNMVVINESGLVGKVISVSSYTSRVLLILDSGNTVSVKIKRNNLMGVLKGNGDGTCSLLYIPSGEDVKIGDIVVTSEASELYPSGIMVGKVIDVKEMAGEIFLDITVTPSVNFSSIYYLWIIK